MTRVAAMLDGGDGSDVLWWVLEEAGPAQPSGLDYAALLRAYRCASDAHAAAALRTGMRHRIRACMYSIRYRMQRSCAPTAAPLTRMPPLRCAHSMRQRIRHGIRS